MLPFRAEENFDGRLARLSEELGTKEQPRYNGEKKPCRGGFTMTLTVRAVYAGGVLRPVQPLDLEEGESVELTIHTDQPARQAANDDEVTQRLGTAATLAEWVEATKLLPADDGGYDVVKALNENRVWSGDRPLLPDEGTTR